MANTLDPGDVRVGHLFDGVDDGHPVQTATLTFDEKLGARLTVPYLWQSEGGVNPHYRKVIDWFGLDSSTLPKTLLFVDDRGSVTFLGARATMESLGAVPKGGVGAQSAIFGRPRGIRDEYLVEAFLSTIDGLDEFVRFKPINLDVGAVVDNRRRVTVTIDTADSVQWEHDGFSYLIQSNAAWNGQGGRSFHILDSDPYLQTTNNSGATLFGHLTAQWPIRALLVLVFGAGLSWRSHRLRDNQFPLWMLDGSARDGGPVQVHMASTIEQHRFPKPGSTDLAFPILRLSDIGAEGMRTWVELYADDVFRHAVEPAVEVMNGASRFLEPQLMMLAISLDRFGYFQFGDNKRRPMHEHIERCLIDANLDWPEIGSRLGIARMISNLNNDLKHPDRETYPETDALVCAVQLAKIIIRAQILVLLGANETLRTDFLRHNDVLHAVRIFTSSGLCVDDQGKFNRSPKSEAD